MALTKLDICNNTLDLIGQGSHIDDLTENSKEADLFRRNFDATVRRCLAKYDFNFARKDEVITNDNLLTNVVSLPWTYTYSLPTDCLRVLYICDLDSDSRVETIRREQERFNFRQISGSTKLVTDKKAPFIIEYIANIEDVSLFSDVFTEALEYLLGARIASALIHGTTGLQIASSLLQQGSILLHNASCIDAQQGADSIQPVETPSIISARN